MKVLTISFVHVFQISEFHFVVDNIQVDACVACFFEARILWHELKKKKKENIKLVPRRESISWLHCCGLEQCDQMLELKVAKFFQKLAKKVDT